LFGLLIAIQLTDFFSTISAEIRPESEHIVRIFEQRYRSSKTLEATFLERYTENGQAVRIEAGKAYFRRPGKMRWDYESPEKNLFLVDGKTVWFYVPVDHTVTRVPTKESDDWRTPLALLTGQMNVSRVCSRVGIATTQKPEKIDNTVLYCILRGSKTEGSSKAEEQTENSSRTKTVFFEITTNSGELVRILVSNPGGVEIEFKFANWQFDSLVPESVFHFEVPKGTAIVNGALPNEYNETKP